MIAPLLATMQILALVPAGNTVPTTGAGLCRTSRKLCSDADRVEHEQARWTAIKALLDSVPEAACSGRGWLVRRAERAANGTYSAWLRLASDFGDVARASERNFDRARSRSGRDERKIHNQLARLETRVSLVAMRQDPPLIGVLGDNLVQILSQHEDNLRQAAESARSARETDDQGIQAAREWTARARDLSERLRQDREAWRAYYKAMLGRARSGCVAP